MIRLDKIQKYFNKGKQNEIHVINDISMDLPDKGMVALFGKSGCGKTTLLNVIGGLDGFESGKLTLDGADVRQNTDEIRNRMIGYIFQNYNLNKNETCFDNVANALRLCGMDEGEELKSRTMSALSNVGMDRFAFRMPDTLSGGQQQRIAIARAIVKNPHIILADEPTGNLDESNTVLIMDLLREIANDRLVLLVTHEADLVDHYCDSVIELKDGAVAGSHNNLTVDSYRTRDKNDIYLGELEEQRLDSPLLEIGYYGESPKEPIKLKIIHSDGKYYLKVDSGSLSLLDEHSEVRLREGVYQEKESLHERKRKVDMTGLPPVEGSHYGSLFSWKYSLKKGWKAIRKDPTKKGRQLLKTCLAMFAAVMVIMTATFGTAFQKLNLVDRAYNHNTFYIYTKDGETSQKILDAYENKQHGVDYIANSINPFIHGDMFIGVSPGAFESLATQSFTTNAVFLDESLLESSRLVAGKKTGLSDSEVVITTAVADALLKKSPYGFINSYESFLGLTVAGSGQLRICGVVSSDEPAIYLSEMHMARTIFRSGNTGVKVAPGSAFGMNIRNGEAIFIYQNVGDVQKVKVEAGQTVPIRGKDFLVEKSVMICNDYENWLKNRGIVKMALSEYCKEEVKKANPGLDEHSDEFSVLFNRSLEDDYYKYWDDYYYDGLDTMIRELWMMNQYDEDLWLYMEKGVEAVRYHYAQTPLIYQAHRYMEERGTYPKYSDTDRLISYPTADEAVQDAKYTYEEEFYRYEPEGIQFGDRGYFVSDEDYIALSKRVGGSHPSALDIGIVDTKTESAEVLKGEGSTVLAVGNDSFEVYPAGTVYTVVHSNDPRATEAWIAENFKDLISEDGDLDGGERSYVITPTMVRNSLMEDYRTDIVVKFSVMAVQIVVMSLCMYFIMRSSLMSRVKEIGIYRAIGVSKKNLVFHFTVETLVMTTATVAVGYCLFSLIIRAILVLMPVTRSMIFYPHWLSLVLLVFLYGICLLCGILPVLSLLKKTPSEILAKYDI